MRRKLLSGGMAVTLCVLGQVLPAQERAVRGEAQAQPAAARGEWVRDLMGSRTDEQSEWIFARLLTNPRMAAELNLTEEQSSTIQDAVAGMKDKAMQLRRELEESAVEQAKLMTADKIDEAALLAAVEKTGGIRTEIAKLNIKALIVLKQVLTPEQIAKSRELMRRRTDLRVEGDKDRKNRLELRKQREGAGGRIKDREPARPNANPDGELR